MELPLRAVEGRGQFIFAQITNHDDQGNPITALEAGAYLSSTDYDALDRVLKVTDAANGITEYGYNAIDQLETVKDPTGLTTTYTYNAFGEVIQQTSPDTGTTTYQYDPAGNRIQQTDARNVTVSYSYDALNRPVLADYPGSLEDVQYGYDAGTHGVGRLTSVQDESGTTSYAYDPRGTLQQATRSIQGQSYVTQYGYDAADQLTSITYPSGRLVSYARNNLGQVTAVETTRDGTTTTLASGIEYLPFGPSQGMTLGNGLTDSRDFDLDYRVTSIATAALDLSYSYDTRNNVSGIADNLDSARSQSFGYDALSRLNAALGDYGSLSYSYDAIGNRLTETDDGVTTSYTYDTQSHHLLTVGTTAYGYDAAGNVTQKGNQALDYNQANRLVSVHQNGLELVSHLYNANGQRVMKSAGSQATLYHYGPSGSLLAETDTAGEVQLERVYLNGVPLAQFTPADPITTQPIEEELPVPLPVPIEDPIEPVVPLIEPTPVYPPVEPVVQCMRRGRFGFYSTFVRGRFGSHTSCAWSRFHRMLLTLPVTPPFVQPPLLPPPPPPPALPPEVPPTPFTPPPEENGFKVAYFHLDHLGTPQRLTDRSQTTVWDASYEPFGEVNLKRNRVEQPLRFPGQVADPETGTHDNWWRTYSPGTGRYDQSDPIGLTGGINTYAYALQNPIGAIDRNGLEVEAMIGGSHWYSHAALRVNNTVYSNGRYLTGNPEIDAQRSANLSGQALRGPNILRAIPASAYPTDGVTGYVLDISPEGERQIIEFYESLISQSSPVSGRSNWWVLPDKYSFVGNNCADLSGEGIRAGLPWYFDPFVSSQLTFPALLETELGLSPWLVRSRNEYGP